MENVAKLVKKRNKQEGALKEELKALATFTQGSVEITLPIRTVSEGNCSEHWHKKARRHTIQQAKVSLLLKPLRKKINLPCQIKLTRYAPRKLDKHDNLPMSFKWIADSICAIITEDYRAGRADDDDRISISYDQVSCPHYGVKIAISFEQKES